MKADRSRLASVLDEIFSAVVVRPNDPVLLQGGRIVASDFKNTLSIEIETGVDAAVPFLQLRQFVKAVPAEQVELKQEEAKLRVIAGRSRLALAYSQAEVILPRPGIVKGSLTLPGSDLKRLIDLSAFASSRDRPTLYGAFFHQTNAYLRSVATDTKRLAEAKVIVEGKLSKGVLIPRPALDAMARSFGTMAQVELEDTGNILIVRGEGKTMHALLMEDDFPRYQALLAQQGEHKVRAKREDLLAALKPVGAVVGDDAKRVLLDLGPGGLRLSVKSELVGEAAGETEVEYEGGGVQVTVNYFYLNEALQKIPTPEVHIWLDDRRGKPLIFEPVGEESVRILVAPMVA